MSASGLSLGQFDDVSVGVFVACAPSPGLGSGFMEDFRAGVLCCSVSGFEVGDFEGELRASGGAGFRFVEGEVEEGAFGPRRGAVPSADPAIVALVVVGRLQGDAEPVAVQRRGTVEVGDLENDRDDAVAFVHSGIFTDWEIRRCEKRGSVSQ